MVKLKNKKESYIACYLLYNQNAVWQWAVQCCQSTVSSIHGPLARAELDIVVDQSSLEIFVNKGASVFTSQMFPDTPLDQLRVSSDTELTLASARSFTLGSIWK